MRDEDKTKEQLIEELKALRAAGGAAAAARRRLADGLCQREEKLQAVINSTPGVAIETYDAEGRVLTWNNAAETVFGWSREDAVGKTLDQLILSPEANEEFLLALKTIAATGKQLGPDEWAFRNKDGKEGFLLSTISQIAGAGANKEFVCVDVDITERKRAEEALRESEKLYRLFIENFDGIAYQAKSLSYSPTLFHGKGKEITGYAAEEFLSGAVRWNELVHPEDMPALHEETKKLAENPDYVSNIKYRIIRKDGAARWVRDICRRVAAPWPETERITQGAIYDITEKTQAEQQVSLFLEKFNGIAYHTIPANFNPLLFKGAIEDITGYTPEEFEAGEMSWDRIVLPEDFPGAMAEAMKMLSVPGYVTDNLYRIRRKDGEVRWMHDICSLIPGGMYGQGVVTHGAIYDITGMMRAEEALKKERDLLSVIMDTCPAVIFLLDKSGKTTYMNKYARESLDIDLEAMKNAAVWAPNWKFYSLDGAPLPLEELPAFKAATTLKPANNTYTVEFPNGRKISISANCGPLMDENGDFAGAVTVAIDVTEKIDIERELDIHRQGLEKLVEDRTRKLLETQEKLVASERLAVLGHFAGSLAHELRNPLGAISGFAYLLKAKTSGMDEKISGYATKIENQIERSVGIIESVLNLTRMEPPRHSQIDISVWLRDECAAVKTPENISFSFSIPGAPMLAVADAGQLSIVFRNLIRNASDAMPGGGKLTVAAKEVISGQSRFAQITVADTGAGIPADNIEHIFKPLFTTKIKGIGFGLPIVKMIVDKHGGEITASSEEGKGARFRLRVPLAGSLGA